jgi:DNA topoisomerase-3
MEVVKRFTAQFMPPAAYNNIELITQVGEHEFITRGRTLKSKGWKQLFSSQEEPEQGEGDNQEEEPEDNITASNLNIGVGVVTDTAELKEGITQAPSHYTEKTLLAAMENCGKKVVNEDDVLKGFTIGTPATRSDTIKKLISTRYVTRKENTLSLPRWGQR